MFVVDIETIAFHRRALITSDDASQITIFRIIFVISSAVRSSLDVASRSIETRIASPDRIFRDHVTNFISEVNVIGSSENTAGGIAHRTIIFIRIIRSGG